VHHVSQRGDEVIELLPLALALALTLTLALTLITSIESGCYVYVCRGAARRDTGMWRRRESGVRVGAAGWGARVRVAGYRLAHDDVRNMFRESVDPSSPPRRPHASA
jgi:hypothetical protein